MHPDYRPALAEFRALPENWNSYGAMPTTQTACEKLLAVVETLLPAKHPACAIVPTPQGGVQLEWHRGGIDAELEVCYSGLVECYVDRGGEEHCWVGDYGAARFAAYLREHLPLPAEC